jgi:hypothetical protein
MAFTEAQKKQLLELPGFEEIKQAYQKQKGMGRMKGKGFWSDLWEGIKSTAKSVDAWLTRTKALSTAGKVIAAITAVIPGLEGVAPVALAASKAGEAMGYGKKKGGRKLKGGRYKIEKGEIPEALGFINPALGMAAKTLGYGKGKMTANDLAQHINPVAGPRGFVSHGMGTMVQNYQSPSMKMIGGTFPSHLQPFLTTRKIGGGVAQAIGSIGNATKLKI